RAALVCRGRTDARTSRGRDPGGDPSPRPARVAPLRGLGRGPRDVELEARQGDARPTVEPRRARHRRPAGVSTSVRPAPARVAAGGALGATAEPARAVARTRAEGRACAGCAD